MTTILKKQKKPYHEYNGFLSSTNLLANYCT